MIRSHKFAGLLFDRQFMVVKESGGRFLTQRQFPK